MKSNRVGMARPEQTCSTATCAWWSSRWSSRSICSRLRGAKLACPPSVGRGSSPPAPGTRKASPRPVPGASTALTAPGRGVPGLSGCRSPGSSRVAPRAVATRSLISQTCRRRCRDANWPASSDQARLVRVTAWSITGPATPMQAQQGSTRCRARNPASRSSKFR